jgi:hypothetical protein
MLAAQSAATPACTAPRCESLKSIAALHVSRRAAAVSVERGIHESDRSPVGRERKSGVRCGGLAG